MTKQEEIIIDRIASLRIDLDAYYNLLVYWKEKDNITALGAWAIKIYQCTSQIESLEMLQTLINVGNDEENL